MKRARSLRRLCAANALCMAWAGAAVGGGFERDPHDVALLFKPGRVIDAGARRLWVERTYRDVTPLPGHPEEARGPTASVSIEGSYSAPRLGLKFAPIEERLDCAVTFRRYYGVHLDYGSEWIGRTDKVSFDIGSRSYAFNCRASLASLGSIEVRERDAVARKAGRLSVIAGALEETIDVNQATVVGIDPADPERPALSHLRVSDRGAGWMLGLAWDVPTLPVQASLVYASAVPHRYVGDIALPAPNAAQGSAPPLLIPVEAKANSPRSLQLDLLVPLSEKWIPSLMLRWVQWSTFAIVPVTATAPVGAKPAGTKVAALEAAFRNGLTIEAGLARPVSEKLTVRGGLRWDRGTATGLNPYTNTWSGSLAAVWLLDEGLSVSLVGAYMRASAGRIEASPELRAAHPDLRVNYTADIAAGSARLLQAGLRYQF